MQVSSVSQRGHFLLILSCLWSLVSSPRNWNWQPTLEALLPTCSPIWIPGAPGNLFFHDDLAWHEKKKNETHIAQCSKDKSSGNHPRDPAGREIHFLDSWNLPERTARTAAGPGGCLSWWRSKCPWAKDKSHHHVPYIALRYLPTSCFYIKKHSRRCQS